MGITLPAGWEIIYNKTLRMYDISVLCNVGKNPIWFPRKRYVTLKEVTYLYDIAYLWGNLTEDQKAEWNYASNVIGQHNFNLFTQDTSYRKKNGIGGLATPSLYHQYFVGHLKIENPANFSKIVQYNFRKILFPASFELCYHTNLVADGVNPYARFTIIYNRYVYGRTIEQSQTIEIPLISGWDKAKQQIIDIGGRKGRWRVELELNDVVGDIWFDNIIVEYGGQIRLNDPYCMDVVKYWKGENLPDGTILETIYPTGDAL